MKDMIIKEVLNMIDEIGDIRRINLREVARRIGCAHTNIYNYFKNVDEMLWNAVVPAFHLARECTIDKVKAMNLQSEEEQVSAVFKYNIEFALEHPGLFRFIWLEKSSSSMLAPMGMEESLKQNWIESIELLFTYSPLVVYEQKEKIGRILFGYLNGEISRLINEKYFKGTKEILIQEIIENGPKLLRLLRNDK